MAYFAPYIDASGIHMPTCEDRLTESDAALLSFMISAYIRETPGVLDVEDVLFSVSGRQFSYACSVLTEEGSAAVLYESGP